MREWERDVVKGDICQLDIHTGVWRAKLMSYCQNCHRGCILLFIYLHIFLLYSLLPRFVLLVFYTDSLFVNGDMLPIKSTQDRELMIPEILGGARVNGVC